jgi:hypothetical protein
VFFTSVFVTTCGLGDIIPMTDGGRALVCVWSFFGTTVWLVLLTSIVAVMCDFVYVEIILNSYWYLRRRRLRRAQRSGSSSSQLPAGDDGVEMAEVVVVGPKREDSGGEGGGDGEHKTSRLANAKDHDVVAEGDGGDEGEDDDGIDSSDDEDDDDDLDDDDDDDEDDDDEEAMKKQAEDDEKRAQGIKTSKGEEKEMKAVGDAKEETAPTWKEHTQNKTLMDALLSWRSMLILNAVALTLYFAVHIICTGVLLELEPQMGWLSDNLTPHSYATYFYASFTYSQTICTCICVCACVRVCVCECAFDCV